MSTIRRSIKVWRNNVVASAAVVGVAMSPAALVAAEGGEAGAPAKKVEPWPESRSTESFANNLQRMFGGEGGEGGYGVNDMANNGVTFPKLNDSELKALVTGNTIYNSNYSFKLATDGKVTGYVGEEKNLTGTWKVESDQLCVETTSQKFKMGCHSTALVIDRLLFFRANGKARFTGIVKKG